MGHQPDVPGPGEDFGPDDVLAEADNFPIPDGAMAEREPERDWRRRTREMPSNHLGEPNDTLEPSGEDTLRRTGTDYPAISIAGEESTEQRADHSAEGGLREQRFDPAQDDTGPQPD